MIRVATVAVLGILAERGNVYLAGRGGAEYRDDSKAGADSQRFTPAKDFLDLVRYGIGRNVIVLGFDSKVRCGCP